ncbi:nucleoside/nucleotide kinase family protein [Albirhodobacter sp. R86504]|uniref:nucleoside/nucleotide kinase family protein n=1 Tax=Albirhodobacter sp. R86504 TaxID=3093848 RepID=UPI00366EC911
MREGDKTGWVDPDGPMGDAGATMPGELRVPRADLASHIESLPGPRSITAIVGAPGSGKSRLANEIAQALNARRAGSAMVVPMDGFHFDDDILTARGLRQTKGAPDTFDVAGLLALIKRLKSIEPETAIPVFDRQLELSRAGAAIVPATVRHILLEGNYLLLARDPWRQLAQEFDLSIRLNVAESDLRDRLTRRWQQLQIAPEEITRRVEQNDLPNGRLLLTHARAADLVVDEFA